MPDILGPRAALKEVMASGVRHYHLGLGECIVLDYPALIQTVLGSCVAATFHHPLTGFSALFHAVLPSGPEFGEEGEGCKFVDSAIRGIARRMADYGIKTKQVEVKLFGGSFSLDAVPCDLPSTLNVGVMNVEQARLALKTHGFVILAEDVRGTMGRTLYFYTGTGQVWVRRHEGKLLQEAGRKLAEDKDACRIVDIRRL